MSSYVVIDTETLDEEAYSEFAAKIADALAAHGGTFLVRGGNPEAMEGDWRPQRLVIMQFESANGASEFLSSAEYTTLDELRHRAVRSSVLAVQGYDG